MYEVTSALSVSSLKALVRDETGADFDEITTTSGTVLADNEQLARYSPFPDCRLILRKGQGAPALKASAVAAAGAAESQR